MKACNRCNVVKPYADFNKDKGRKDGHSNRCRVCTSEARPSRMGCSKIKEYNKAYHKDNKEYLNSRYHTVPGYRETQLRRYHSKKDEINAKAAEYRKTERWRVKNAAKESRRRSRKLNATPPWLTEEHLKQIDYLHWLARDASITSGCSYHVDHIVPLKGKNVCGLHVPWNLQVLPADINLSKSNRYKE